MPRPSLRRLGLVLIGFVAAVCAGIAAVWLKNRGVSEADQLAMSGMYAFGDLITFLAVAAVTAIPPTVLLFQSIGNAPGFWRVYCLTSLLASSTGVIAALLFLLPFEPTSAALSTLQSLSPLRVLSAPLFLLAFAPGLLPVAGPGRRLSLIACVLELCALGSLGVKLLMGSSAA